MGPERQLQRGVAGYLSMLEMQGKLTFFAVPNGGSRHPAEAANLKRDGVRAGVSDIVVIWQNKVGFIELKSPTGRTTVYQDSFASYVRSFGHQYVVIRDMDELKAVLLHWGVLSPREAA